MSFRETTSGGSVASMAARSHDIADAILAAVGARAVLMWTSDGRTLTSRGWDVGRDALRALRTAFGAEEGPADYVAGHDALGAAGQACPESCDRFSYMRTDEDGAGLLCGFDADAGPFGGSHARRMARLAVLAASSHFDDTARLAGARLATIGEIVNGIAHDIGTPLNVISGYAESMLMSETDETSPRRKQVSAIVEQTRRVATMVRQMLDIVRPLPDHATRNQPLDLFGKDVLQITSHMLRGRDVRIRLDTSGARAAIVTGDLPQISYAVFAVLRGAARAVGAKGQLVLRPVSDSGQGIGFAIDARGADGQTADLSALDGDRRFEFDEILMAEQTLDENGATLQIVRDKESDRTAGLFIRLQDNG